MAWKGGRTMNETVQTQCPKCGEWEDDEDGFGVLSHIGEGYRKPCGYCSHPSSDGGVCGICGKVDADAI